MSKLPENTIDVSILEPAVNQGYRPLPIPVARDNEVVALLSQAVAEKYLAALARQLTEGNARVLRAFAERAATAAVRNRDPALLHWAMTGLLLSWREDSDYRDVLIFFPVLYDAIKRMGIDVGSFTESIRQTVGDKLVAHLNEFLLRSEHNKSLQVMGYSIGTDADGFRYVRNR